VGIIIDSHLDPDPITRHLAAGTPVDCMWQECGATTKAPGEPIAGLAAAAAFRVGCEIGILHFAIIGLSADCRKGHN
jgi:hypothetical protein